jgi:hypothetical protein
MEINNTHHEYCMLGKFLCIVVMAQVDLLLTTNIMKAAKVVSYVYSRCDEQICCQYPHYEGAQFLHNAECHI